MRVHSISIGILITLMCFPVIGYSQENSTNPEKESRLQVSTIQRPPFALVGQDGLEGFSIDLWEEIARDNNWQYNYVVHDSFVAMLRAIKQPGESDLAIANISITPEREEIMDFSAEIYSGGLQILLTTQPSRIIENLFENERLQQLFGVLALVFVLTGWIIHRISISPEWNYSLWRNYAHLLTLGFSRPALPKQDRARTVIRIWNVSALVLVTALALEVTNFVSVATKDPQTVVPQDLEQRVVGVTSGSTAENFLRKLRIPTVSYRSSRLLFNDVQDGSIDAAVHDAPVIQHYVNTRSGIQQQATVAGSVFSQDRYGIAMPTDSQLRERINKSIDQMKEDGRYAMIYRKWFGE